MPMTENRNPFMPFIKDFEKEAEAFLRHYGCEEVLTVPGKIPIEEIIRQKMSVDIIESECLSPDGSVQGITAFSKGILETYDPALERYTGYELHAPAILIDCDICSEPYRRMLLAHEAFHWYKHRHYFLYRSQHELGDEFAFRCGGTIGGGSPSGSWTDAQRMEWQARKIAPMILMPAPALRKKLDDLCGEDGEIHAIKAGDALICELADFFGVTSYVVQKRLAGLGLRIDDAGCEEVRFWEKKTLVRDRVTYNAISPGEAFRLFQEDALFRKYIGTGLFIFQENTLTARFAPDVAKNRALVFEECLIPVSGENRMSDVMFHQNETYRKQTVFRNTPQNAQLLDDAAVYERQFLATHERKAKNYKTANEILWDYMCKAHWNTAIFQDRTLLAPMDYVRVRDPDHKFKLPSYVAMSVGLGLSITEFQEVIRHAGMALVDGNKEHDAYAFVLSVMQGKGIDACNEFLESIGVKTLGTHSRG